MLESNIIYSPDPVSESRTEDSFGTVGSEPVGNMLIVMFTPSKSIALEPDRINDNRYVPAGIDEGMTTKLELLNDELA